jgi:hypothetical protein
MFCGGQFMDSKSLWEKIEFILTAKWFAPIILLIGLVTYTLTQYVINPIPIEKLSNGFKIFVDIVKLLSGTLISTGLISLFLRISTMRQNIETSVIKIYKEFMSKILLADFNLEGYDGNVLNNLKRRIVLHTSNNSTMDVNMLNSSVYSLEKTLVKFTKGLYLEYHERTTIITPNKAKNVFKKKVITKYKTVNLYGLANKIDIELSLLPGTDTSINNFKFSDFYINNTNLCSEIDELTKFDNSSEANYNTYMYKVKFSRPLQKCKEHVIKLTFEYEVPMFDLTHTYRISTPCKKLNHNIILDGKEAQEWELIVSGFAPGINDDAEDGNNYQVSLLTSSNAQINFQDWTLPGEGYVVILKSKNSMDKQC